MTRFAQQKFDGIAVDRTKGRFAGTFELEDSEAEVAALDEVLVCAVVVRIRQAVPTITKAGDLEVVKRFDVTDMRVITDEKLREEIVLGAGLIGADSDPSLFPATVGSPVASAATPAPAPPEGVTDDGEILSDEAREAQERYVQLAEDDDLDEDDEDDTVTVGSIRSGPADERPEAKAFAAFMEGA